jgi:hypothetical protein
LRPRQKETKRETAEEKTDKIERKFQEFKSSSGITHDLLYIKSWNYLKCQSQSDTKIMSKFRRGLVSAVKVGDKTGLVVNVTESELQVCSTLIGRSLGHEAKVSPGLKLPT